MMLTPEQRDVVDRIKAKAQAPRPVSSPTPEQIAARRRELAARAPVRPRYVDGFCANDCDHRGPFVQSDEYVLCVPCATHAATERRGPERGYEPQGGLPTVTEGARASRNDPAYQRAAKLDDAWSRAPGAPSEEPWE